MKEWLRILILDIKIQWYAIMLEHYNCKVHRHNYNLRKVGEYNKKKLLAEIEYDNLPEESQ